MIECPFCNVNPCCPRSRIVKTNDARVSALLAMVSNRRIQRCDQVIFPNKEGSCMKLLAFLLLLPFVGWTQQPPACTWKATATVSGAQASCPNNTASPICNAFALSWNSTGFSGVSIELQGSDNNASWTTFTGTSTVLVGTNPQTGLTGTIIIQASATLAFIRVNLTSLTGSGSVSYQIYGYNGVTPAAKSGSGGSGGSAGSGS